MKIDFLKTAIDYNEGIFKAAVNDINHGESLQSPHPFMNNINWITGHLINTRNELLKTWGSPLDLPLEFTNIYGTGSTFNHKEAYDFEELQELFNTSSVTLSNNLENIEIDGSDEKAFPAINNFFLHEAYHIGQIGIIRKYLGKDALR
jgi:hypothetical protein